MIYLVAYLIIGFFWTALIYYDEGISLEGVLLALFWLPVLFGISVVFLVDIIKRYFYD